MDFIYIFVIPTICFWVGFLNGQINGESKSMKEINRLQTRIGLETNMKEIAISINKALADKSGSNISMVVGRELLEDIQRRVN